jgi:hypothetical protein
MYDLRAKNPGIMSVMELAWILTVIYSGPLGLATYYFSGRKQIAHDSIGVKGFAPIRIVTWGVAMERSSE